MHATASFQKLMIQSNKANRSAMNKVVFAPAKKLLSVLLMSALSGIAIPVVFDANPHATAAPFAAVALPDFANLVEAVGPAVVNIRTTAKVQVADADDDQDAQMQEFFRRFFGVPVPKQQPTPAPKGKKDPQSSDEEVPRGVGSGFIVSQDGYIVTNAHVVTGADEVFVKLTDDREFKAKVIGIDARVDVAVLKIDGKTLPTVTIGQSAKARVGEWVIAIGSPFDLDNTVTAGIISAKARDTGDFLPLIQTDVAVNPGNSGGPLINMRGEVVGINSQIYSKSGGFMGISFAVPIDDAMAIVDQLKTTGHVTRGRLGVYLGDVGKDVAESLGLPSGKGGLVGRVEKDSPADKAGLIGGDIILKFNGIVIDKSTELRRLAASTKPGTKVKLSVWRKGAVQEITATLAEMEPEKIADGSTPDQKNDPVPVRNALGIVAVDLTDAQKKEMRTTSGVAIASVDGAAARAGLHPGDIIVSFNNVDIKDAAQLTALAAKADTKKPSVLLVRRGENSQFVTIRPSAR
jgi:serine protease Do